METSDHSWLFVSGGRFIEVLQCHHERVSVRLLSFLIKLVCRWFKMISEGVLQKLLRNVMQGLET